jgi:hypothetical protein
MSNTNIYEEVSGAIREHGYQIGLEMATITPRVEIDGARLIPADHLADITEMLVLAIAEAIQPWIDAGSERDAVMENEELHAVILEELKGWSNKP